MLENHALIAGYEISPESPMEVGAYTTLNLLCMEGSSDILRFTRTKEKE